MGNHFPFSAHVIDLTHILQKEINFLENIKKMSKKILIKKYTESQVNVQETP